VGPRRPAPHKGRWGPAEQITKLTVPYTPPTPQNPSRSSGEAQPAVGLLTTGATSSPYSAAVPGQCYWRPEGRRDLVRVASTPTIAMATTPPPAPTPSPAIHEGASRTSSLPLSLSLMPRQDPVPDLTYAVAILFLSMVSVSLIYSCRLASGLSQEHKKEGGPGKGKPEP
jgi:hypothetical protein